MRRIAGVFLALFLVADAGAGGGAGRWDAAMEKFAKEDRESPPQPGGLLFAGSSTILFWDLEKHFPGMGARNRGFGGSTFADLLAYYDRVIVPYAPKTLVLYSGDNDIGGGTPP